MKKVENYTTENKGIIPLHFGVTEHSMPLNQFISAATSTQAIIDNFNKEFFDNKLKYQINILTPKKGSVIELLELYDVQITSAAVLTFFGSDNGKALIKGLTGNEPSFWFEEAGLKMRAILSSKKTPPLIVSIILAQITLGFLKKETGELEKIGVSKEKFRSAYSAKNTIYQGCLANKDVQGFGFDMSHDFPIKRKDFPNFITKMPLEQEEEIEEPAKKWIIETSDIIANSPNWKREGRKWQAKTDKFDDVALSIEDEFFWHKVKTKDIKTGINDNMEVQWAYPEGTSKPSNVRVLKVLSYKGKKVSNPLTQEELQQELQEYTVEEQEQDLFNYNTVSKQQEKILLSSE